MTELSCGRARRSGVLKRVFSELREAFIVGLAFQGFS